MLEPEKNGVPPQEKLSVVKCRIPTAEIKDSTGFYTIHVTGSFNNWAVSKRYSQFEEMHNQLLNDFIGRPLPKGLALPPKKFKIWQSHISEAFLEERRVLLENYLKKLLSGKEAAKSKAFMKFITSDKVPLPNIEDSKTAELAMPDDVEVTNVTIPSTRTMSDHVLYQIDVQNIRKRKTFSKWTVLKRFGQFYEMDQAVRAEYAEDLDFLASLPLPPERKAKLLNDHMDSTFIEERRALLEHYLQKMIKVERIVRNPTFLHFLGVNV